MERRKMKRKMLNLNILKEDDSDKAKKLKKKQRKERLRRYKTDCGNKIASSSKTASKDLDDEIIIDDVNDGEDIVKDDPYMIHLSHELNPQLLISLSSKPPKIEKSNSTWPHLGNLHYVKPMFSTSDCSDVAKKILVEENIVALPRDLPNAPSLDFRLESLFIKSQIHDNIKKTVVKQNSSELTNVQRELLTLMCHYHDIYYPEVNLENVDKIRLAYCIHVVNHVLKSRLKIVHHNSKLSKHPDVPEDFRDQGLVRPKVLILLPFRESALRTVRLLRNILLGDGGHVMNLNRFNDEYTGDTINMPEKNPRPMDYQLLFTGNTDDNFKIGLTVTKKCLKLYSDFYSSDIIIASPLGLRILIGADGEKDRDYDFLASIEMLILDQANVFLMQNWEHMLHLIRHLHLQPKDSHGTDLARVRMWALNGWSHYYRQSIIFSSHPIPELTALFNGKFCNYGGKVTIINPIQSGTICQVAVHVPQVFHLVNSSTVIESIDDRFEAFVSDVLPKFKDSAVKHTLIFIPSYFDFVRLRNYFKQHEMKFVHICEYTEEKKIIRARSKLFHGETQFMLYTERFHFFRRVKLRGIKNIIFYQPPSNPTFYSEMCNFLQDIKSTGIETGESQFTVNVLYTKYDITQIASIVGTERATRMLASDKLVHMFMADG